MRLDIIYAGTQDKLNKQVEEKMAEGWEKRGEALLVRPDYSGSTIEVPQFVYYLQVVVKES